MSVRFELMLPTGPSWLPSYIFSVNCSAGKKIGKVKDICSSKVMLFAYYESINKAL